MGTKYIICGRNNPYVIENVLNTLHSGGYKIASLATNDLPEKSELSWIYSKYTRKDIASIIDNNIYLFWGTLYDQTEAGLIIPDLENSDIIWMPVPCSRFFNKSALKDNKICFVWIDDTLERRTKNTMYYTTDSRIFSSNEYYENLYTAEFTQLVCTSGYEMIYFSNEEPDRISTILSILIDYPETHSRILKNFN